jgi:hypothetical protein
MTKKLPPKVIILWSPTKGTFTNGPLEWTHYPLNGTIATFHTRQEAASRLLQLKSRSPGTCDDAYGCVIGQQTPVPDDAQIVMYTAAKACSVVTEYPELDPCWK